jgi:hypothetical protein
MVDPGSAPITWTEIGGLAIFAAGFAWLSSQFSSMRRGMYAEINRIAAMMLPRTEAELIVKRLDDKIAFVEGRINTHQPISHRARGAE